MLRHEVHEHPGAEVVDVAVQRTRALEYMAAEPLPRMRPAGRPVLWAILAAANGGLVVAGLATVMWWAQIVSHGAQAVAFGALAWTQRSARRELLATSGAVVGVVQQCGVLSAPGTEARCAAFEIELRRDAPRRRQDLALRYGRTAELAIGLDDGRTVRVPAGSVQLGPPRKQNALGSDRFEAIRQRVVAWVDPSHATSDPVIRFDRLYERCLQVGDRVSLDCELVPIEPSGGEGAGHAYRDAAPAVWAPKGLVRLGVMKR